MNTNHQTPAMQHRFIEPIDVLFLRGNRLFGAPGSHGESLVPPWPSAAAGALRSQMLSDEGIDLNAFAQGRAPHPSLGTPQQPGSFTLTAFHLARDKGGHVETLHALPADLLVTERGNTGGVTGLQIQRLRPLPHSHGLQTSSPFAHIPVLAEKERQKAESGFWLTHAGWGKYLNGHLPNAETDLVRSSDLWALDSRVGIGLNPSTRSADDGKLFTTQALAFKPGVGFVASVRGAQLPEQGGLRFGGDGRAARSQSVKLPMAQADLHALAAQGRCRLVLTAPGVFSQGWLPNGFVRQDDGSFLLDLNGVRASLLCASVPRAETISGWDLARWLPKSAQRSAPTGSVYWLEDLRATPEALGKLAEHGLWNTECEDPHRRAEGFNRFSWAAFSLD